MGIWGDNCTSGGKSGRDMCFHTPSPFSTFSCFAPEGKSGKYTPPPSFCIRQTCVNLSPFSFVSKYCFKQIIFSNFLLLFFFSVRALSVYRPMHIKWFTGSQQVLADIATTHLGQSRILYENLFVTLHPKQSTKLPFYVYISPVSPTNVKTLYNKFVTDSFVMLQWSWLGGLP